MFLFQTSPHCHEWQSKLWGFQFSEAQWVPITASPHDAQHWNGHRIHGIWSNGIHHAHWHCPGSIWQDWYHLSIHEPPWSNGGRDTQPFCAQRSSPSARSWSSSRRTWWIYISQDPAINAWAIQLPGKEPATYSKQATPFGQAKNLWGWGWQENGLDMKHAKPVSCKPVAPPKCFQTKVALGKPTWVFIIISLTGTLESIGSGLNLIGLSESCDKLLQIEIILVMVPWLKYINIESKMW